MLTVEEYYKNGTLIFEGDSLIGSNKLNDVFKLKYGGYYLLNENPIYVRGAVDTILNYNAEKYSNMLKAIQSITVSDPLNQSKSTINNTTTSSSSENYNDSTTSNNTSNTSNNSTTKNNSTSTNKGDITSNNTSEVINKGSAELTSTSTTDSTKDSTNSSTNKATGGSTNETGKRTYNSNAITPIDTTKGETTNTGETTSTSKDIGKDTNTTSNTSTNNDTINEVGENLTKSNMTGTISNDGSVTNEGSTINNSTTSNTGSKSNTADSLTENTTTSYNNLSEAVIEYINASKINIIDIICYDVFNAICIPLVNLDDSYY